MPKKKTGESQLDPTGDAMGWEPETRGRLQRVSPARVRERCARHFRVLGFQAFVFQRICKRGSMEVRERDYGKDGSPGIRITGRREPTKMTVSQR